jgi:hypothetical protein
MKTSPVDYEAAVRDYPLDEEAANYAIDAATESNNAGDEPQKQLLTAIAVYLAIVDFKDAGE